MSLCETRLGTTWDTDSLHFLYFLGHWDQVNEVAELVPVDVTIQSCTNDSLPVASNLVDNRRQLFSEKLSLVNTNDICLFKCLGFEKALFERFGDYCGPSSSLVMCDDRCVATFVSIITCVLDKNHSFSCNFMSLQTPQQLCAFSREHGSNNDLNPSLIHVMLGATRIWLGRVALSLHVFSVFKLI